MLVEVADSVQPPERMRLVGTSSMVRLKRFDFVDCLCRNSSDLPVESLDVSLRGRRMVEDRKLRGLRRVLARQSRQTPDQLIETGTHVVGGVTNGKTSVVGHIKKLALETMPLLLKIVIPPHSVSLRPSELFQQNV